MAAASNSGVHRQRVGTDCFVRHLQLNRLVPFVFGGREPAAFARANWTMGGRLEAAAEELRSQRDRYPTRLPYGIAVAPKGFYGEGINLAHNLP